MASRLRNALIVPFYFMRFLYHSVKERSAWFYRYYPGHYGSTIPSAADIRKNRQVYFATTPPTYDGVDINAAKQRETFLEIAKLYCDFSPSEKPLAGKYYYSANAMFGFNDGFVLYAFMRMFRPSRVIEVGSGYSSALMIDTSIEFNLGTHFTFIDPYSPRIGPLLGQAKYPNFEIVRERVQDVDLSIFSKLKHNDILFIDSSHVVKIGSDLSTLIFSVLPALNEGVIVHFHDIYYPFEYPESMLMEGRNWNEVYFIHAFLQFNSAFEVIFMSSYAETEFSKYILENMPKYAASSGQTLWLRKKSAPMSSD